MRLLNTKPATLAGAFLVALVALLFGAVSPVKVSFSLSGVTTAEASGLSTSIIVRIRYTTTTTAKIKHTTMITLNAANEGDLKASRILSRTLFCDFGESGGLELLELN